jgi:hypothetical protein
VGLDTLDDLDVTAENELVLLEHFVADPLEVIGGAMASSTRVASVRRTSSPVPTR